MHTSQRITVALTLAALMLAAPGAAANSARIKAIKRLYKAVNAGIKAKAITARTVQANVVVPGIGDQGRTVTFYQRADRALARVHTSYNVAASGDYDADYLFDAAGKLAFYFAKSRAQVYCESESYDVRTQLRLYFTPEGELVRYLLERADPDADREALKGRPCAEQVIARRRADRGFSRAEQAAAKRARANAAFLARLHVTFKRGKAKAARRVLRGKDVDEKL